MVVTDSEILNPAIPNLPPKVPRRATLPAERLRLQPPETHIQRRRVLHQIQQRHNGRSARAALLPLAAQMNRAHEHPFPLITLAAENGHEAIVLLLLEHGADPNTQNCRNQSALLLAILCEHIPVLRLLLAQENIDLDPAADDDCRTPFAEAVHKERLDTIENRKGRGARHKKQDWPDPVVLRCGAAPPREHGDDEYAPTGGRRCQCRRQSETHALVVCSCSKCC